MNRAWVLTGEMVNTVAEDIERLKAEKAAKEQVRLAASHEVED